MKQVVVLGGGVGGSIVANSVARRFHEDEVKVTLISDTGKHVYHPGNISVALGSENPESLVKDERGLLSKRIKLVVEAAKKIDPNERYVLANGTRFDYDYLVVATGARLVPEEIPGYTESAYHFYDVPNAMKLRDALINFKKGRIVIGVGSVPYRCPPAPLEFAFLLDEYFTKKRIRDQVEIEYLYPINGVFVIRAVEPALAKMLEERRIAYRTLFNTDSIDPSKREVNSLEGESVKYDMLVMVPPHRGTKVVEDSGLGDRGGWFPTNKFTLRSAKHDDIYALGDATDIPISKAGSTAHYEGKIVSERLISELGGESAAIEYDGHVFCFLETGYGKGITLNFNYSKPPSPSKPNRIAHIEKMILNKLYWSTVPKARV